MKHEPAAVTQKLYTNRQNGNSLTCHDGRKHAKHVKSQLMLAAALDHESVCFFAGLLRLWRYLDYMASNYGATQLEIIWKEALLHKQMNLPGDIEENNKISGTIPAITA